MSCEKATQRVAFSFFGLAFMLKKLAGWFDFFRGAKKAKIGDDEIHSFLALMPAQKASVLKDQIRIQAELRKGLSDEYLGVLTKLARQYGWDDDECLKIRIFADYFSDRIAPAYEAIVKNKFYESDFDMFVVACLSLYLNDEFDAAYNILIMRDPESPEFAQDINFMAFAGYIAFSSGKDMKAAANYYLFAEKNSVDTVAFATNAYVVYFEAGELEAVERVRKLIHRSYSKDPQAVHALSYVELARGYYPEGFRLAEYRYDHPDAFRHFDISLLNNLRWRGESLNGRRILVHGEQGLGDTIMCARYLKLLQAMSAGVVFECQPEAIPLLQPNFPDIPLIAIGEKRAADLHFDYWVGSMSLPLFFNSTTTSIPDTKGYLKLPNEYREYWHRVVNQTINGIKPKIGLAWSGNPRHRSDRRRSVPFDKIAPYIAAFEGANWISLQLNIPDDSPETLLDFVAEMPTLGDTAALIEEMDLIITVDTSIVHLAGALGKSTWLLLPYRYEWRWGMEGDGNPWYDSVRVIRQPSHGDWKAVLDEVFLNLLPQFTEKWGGKDV